MIGIAQKACLLAGCGWLMATAGMAQQRLDLTAPPVASKWFVHAQLTAQRYRLRYPVTGLNEQSVLPAQVGAGVQLTPRLGVQLSAAYRRQQRMLAPSDPANPAPLAAETWRLLALPVWARYTLTRTPAHRVQFDMVGGLTVLSGRHTYPWRGPAGTGSTAPRGGEDKLEAQLNYGLSLRCRVARRLEVVADGAFNQGLGRGRRPFNPAFYSANAGLRFALH